MTSYEFKYLVEMDVLEEYIVNGMRISFLNFVCDGAGPQSCGPGAVRRRQPDGQGDL